MIPGNMMKQHQAQVAEMRVLWCSRMDTFATPHKDIFASRDECISFMKWIYEDPNHSWSSRQLRTPSEDTIFHDSQGVTLRSHTSASENERTSSLSTTQVASYPGEAPIKSHSRIPLPYVSRYNMAKSERLLHANGHRMLDHDLNLSFVYHYNVIGVKTLNSASR